MTNAECAIWGTAAQTSPGTGDFDAYVSVRAGGFYKITRSTVVDRYWNDRSDIDNAKLTTWLFEARRSGTESPLITTDVFDKVRSRPRLGIVTRRDQALLYLANSSATINHGHRFSGAMDDDYKRRTAELCVATESINIQEAVGFLEFLTDAGLLKTRGGDYVLTFEGWNAIEEMSRASSAGEQAFVAMWFDPSMKSAYDNGIEPAIVERGYRSVRIDKKEHINKIDDEIVAEIR